MPPPLFILFIPSVALFFLIQMVVCHAYHFQVTLARQKSKGPPRIDMDSSEDKKELPQDLTKSDRNLQKPQDRKDQSPPGKNDQPIQRRQGRHSQDSSRAGSRDFTEPKPREHVRFSLDSRNGSTQADDRNYEIPIPSSSSDSEESIPPKVDHLSPKEDRVRNRRKSVFAESYDPANDEEAEKVIHPKAPDEKKRLKETLQKITLFQHLANDQLNTVVDAMYKVPVIEGEYITKEGDKGNTFYVVQDGVFDVFVRDEEDDEQLVHTYDHDGSFGELALLYNQPRAASIVARSDGTLWAVDGQTFRRIIYKITYQKRLMYESLINNVPMLKALEPYERANLVDALIPMTFHQDQQIVKQGDEADGMYFIVSGGVRVVYQDENNKDNLLNELSNSDYFGELALVADQPRAASAYSVGTTHLAFLDRDAFERLLGPCMEVMRRKIDGYNDQLSEVLKDRN